MRPAFYEKTMFTLIALLLAAIALKPILQPPAVMAQGRDARNLVLRQMVHYVRTKPVGE